jgi:hypothetical protein
MTRILRVIFAALSCCAAAMTVRYAFNSEMWQHVRIFAFNLPWQSTAGANIAVHILDCLLVAILGGAYSTLIVLFTRMSAVAAAAILSITVFIGARFGLLLSVLDGGDADFLVGHVEMTVILFAFGWLIAALVLRFWRRPRQINRAVAN